MLQLPHRGPVRPVVLAGLLLATSALAADLTQPRFPPGDTVTDYSGVKVADPYRGLEDLANPAVQSWAEGQQAYTRQQLDRLPGLAALRARVDAIDAVQTASIGKLEVTTGGAWFYLKREPGQTLMRLMTRQGADGQERLVFDPMAGRKAGDAPQAINNFHASPDGRQVALVVSLGDAELGSLQVIDTRSGHLVGPATPGIWGELRPEWSRDGQRLYITRGADALKEGGEPFGKMQLFARARDGAELTQLAGWGSPAGLDVKERDWLFFDDSSERYVLAQRAEGVSGMSRLAFARRADWQRDPLHARWTELVPADAGSQDLALSGHHVYARTFNGAARYRIVRYDLDRPQAAPQEVVPQAEGVIDGMSAAREGLYYIVRTGSVSTLHLHRWNARPGPGETVALPYVGAVDLVYSDPRRPGLVLVLQGWAHEARIYQTQGHRVEVTSLVPPSGSPIGSDWVSEEAECTSHDGARVPMSIIYRQGLKKDGSHPTLIDGYGGYGVSEPAYFNRKLDPWLQRGGIFVDVKPRGGGAYGRAWYQAGVGARKSNTWKDMIACGEALVAAGWTSRAKLAIQGTSMGGVAVGRAVTERPDLFAAGIVRVGITEAVRFIEATGNGPNHLDEMGSVKTEAGIRQLLAMSTYHQVKDGEKYPALLFTAGMNDNRVAPWISFKTFARMAAASTSGKPVLLRVESQAGHGVSSSSATRNAEWADRQAFLLWVMGDPDFQPAAAK